MDPSGPQLTTAARIKQQPLLLKIQKGAFECINKFKISVTLVFEHHSYYGTAASTRGQTLSESCPSSTVTVTEPSVDNSAEASGDFRWMILLVHSLPQRRLVCSTTVSEEINLF